MKRDTETPASTEPRDRWMMGTNDGAAEDAFSSAAPRVTIRRKDRGYCFQVSPPATATGAARFSVLLSPSCPCALYPQQRPVPSWAMPQVL